MNDETITTLLIKLPVGLKSSFAGLCSGRGVSVSEELRRFMADELVRAVSDMASKDRITNSPTSKKIPVVRASKKRSKAAVADNNDKKCDSTADMFDDQNEVSPQKRAIDAFNAKQADIAKQSAKNVTQDKMKLSEGVMDGIKARDSRKKSKKR